jgi:hypothetical protein
MTAKTYTFKQNGKKHSIPLLSDVPMGAIRKARKAVDDGDRAFIILESFLVEGSPALDAIDQMNATEFKEFLEGWTQGGTLGE